MSDPAMVRPRRGPGWYLQGRAGRGEYWAVTALIFAVCIALSFVPNLGSASIGGAIALAMIQVRRLHDLGRTGWWALAILLAPLAATLVLAPVAGLEIAAGVGMLIELALIVALGAIVGDAGENRFGPPAPFSWRRALSGR